MDYRPGDQRQRRLWTKLNRLAQPARRTPIGVALCTIVTGIVLSTFLPACRPGERNVNHAAVATSLAPLAYVVDRIGAPHIRAARILPAGADPHMFEPSMKELRVLAHARIYVRLGHPKLTFERAWLDALLRDHPQLTVIDAGVGLAFAPDDPHVWLSPRLMRRITRNIADELQRLVPEHAGAIDHAAMQFDREIIELDRELRSLFETKRGRRFFVFHPAWGYFARDYGLVQVAVERDGREPDPHTLTRIIEQARRAGVRVIFAQPQHSDASARLIAEEIGARVEFLDPMAYAWMENLRESARKIAGALVE